MIKRTLIIVLLLLVSNANYSQSVSSYLRKAKDQVFSGEYYLAADNYLAVLKKDSLNQKANLEYGLLQTQYINNPGNAGVYLLRAEHQSRRDTMPELILGLAQYYHSQGQYQKAMLYYGRMFNHLEKNKDGRILENIIKHNIANCQYASSNPPQPIYKRVKIVNVGVGVNTIYPEYVPVITREGTVLMFTSRRKNNKGNRIDDYDGNYYEDMYLARKDADGTFKNAHPFSETDTEVKGLSNTNDHEAVVSLSLAGDKFFTYRNNKVYESDLQNNIWSAPTLLDDNINSANGFQSHVSISKDGKTMYFSSDRPNGIGGLDIYKSEKQANGSWGPAINLGPSVNTKDDEDSPFISNDGQTLYFASKGHPGYGGYDLFKSTVNGTAWNAPENMGLPFNSGGDDTHMNFNEKELNGFFSSSRTGGFGDMDLYEIKIEKPFSDFKIDSLLRISIKVPDTVYINELTTLGVESSKLSPSAFSDFYWQIDDTIMSVNGQLLTHTFTRLGKATVRIQGESSTDASLMGYEKTIVVSSRPPVIEGNNVTNLRGMESVYFDFNKSALDAETKAAIERNIIIIKNNSGIEITLSAYADSRGATDYNLKLSEKRANTVAYYLKKKGIIVKQISWFGEKDPLNKCTDGVPCTESEYKINRRVEFKITNFKK